MTELTLFYCPGSCSFASHFALEQAGADYRAERVVLSANEQRSDRYLAVNPRGRIPALAVKGQVISETMAILTWIDDYSPAAGLLPRGGVARAKAYELMSWFASGLHISFAQNFRSERFTSNERAAEALRLDACMHVLAAFAEMESRYQASEWLLESGFCIVDVYACVFWRWAPRLEIDTSAFPAWTERVLQVLAMPAAQRVIATEQA